ncbi:helix-turn-helix domain-containing protein [Actinosynnema sp. CA-299493]
MDDGSPAPQSVTGRALALLGAFDPTHRRLRITELARRARLPPSTAHRLAAELVAWGALHRDDSLGSCSVAVAVRGDGGVPVGALGVVVRSVRADPSRVVPGLRPTRRHHNNALRTWDSLPVRVHRA